MEDYQVTDVQKMKFTSLCGVFLQQDWKAQGRLNIEFRNLGIRGEKGQSFGAMNLENKESYRLTKDLAIFLTVRKKRYK